MAERIRDVGDVRDRTQLAGHRSSAQKVSHMRLAAGKQRVGLDVPRPGREPSRGQARDEPVALSGSNLEIVLQDDRLAVEYEAEARVDLDLVEHCVDRVDEVAPECVVRPIPLAVPVEMRDEQYRAGHACMT